MSYTVKVAYPNDVILVDVDCVCADLYGSIRAAAEELGLPFKMFKTYDILEQYSISNQMKLRDIIAAPGFASDMKPIDGAVTGVAELRKLGFKVIFVTSPQKNDHWPIERIHWLQDHFGAGYNDVINSKHKNLIRGRTIIDDHPDHIISWSRANGAPAIWFDGGWSDKPVAQGATVMTARSWFDVIRLVQKC